jgi:DNA segregation ATPase FtsK/SpoIIIE, S-DNA-T family
LGIGYGRGARLIDFMAEDGIVGAYNGSQAREVLVTLEQWHVMSGQNAAAAEPTKPARGKRISPGEDDVEQPQVDLDDEADYEDGDVIDVDMDDDSVEAECDE